MTLKVLNLCTHYGRRGYSRYMVKQVGGNRRTWENYQSKTDDYSQAISLDPRKRDIDCFEILDIGFDWVG